MIRERFEAATAALEAELRPGESFTAWLDAEVSDFVRFNRGRVRQAGSVTQADLCVDWMHGRRHAAGSIGLSDDPRENAARLAALVGRLRDEREQLPDDPWLCLPDDVRSTETIRRGELPVPTDAAAGIVRLADGLDLVGLFASGSIHAAFADSRGQRNWHTVDTFHFDWSVHLEGDRAVKARHAGTTWDDAELARRLDAARREADAMRRPTEPLAPGEIRVWLSPAALREVLGVLSWGGFGLRAHRTRTTPLLRMLEDGATLAPSFTLIENVGAGIAPGFQESGFLRPPRTTLLRGGRLTESLVSPRSAAEYAAPCNGSPANEMPRSLELLGGDVPEAEALERLGAGLWIGELHYLNFSDRAAGRITGLTRFGTFHVRGGELAAPAPVMRFDDTVYRLLGENLLGLSRERERLLEPDTYDRRSTASVLLPGALVEGFRLTL